MPTKLLTIAMVGQTFDVLSTQFVLNMGGVELNPMFGSPTNAILIMLVKMAFILVIFMYTNGMVKFRLLMFGAVIGTFAGTANILTITRYMLT